MTSAERMWEEVEPHHKVTITAKLATFLSLDPQNTLVCQFKTLLTLFEDIYPSKPENVGYLLHRGSLTGINSG